MSKNLGVIVVMFIVLGSLPDCSFGQKRTINPAEKCGLMQELIDNFDMEMPRYRITFEEQRKHSDKWWKYATDRVRGYLDPALEDLLAILGDISGMYNSMATHYVFLAEEPSQSISVPREMEESLKRFGIIKRSPMIDPIKQSVVKLKAACPSIIIPKHIQQLIDKYN